MTITQNESYATSGSSTAHSHDKITRMSSIIEETERIEAESEELIEAIRRAKGEEQVWEEKYSGNKWNFLKRAPAASASKLVIEYPTTQERKNKPPFYDSPERQSRPTAKAATTNISNQVTERREKKPSISADGQEHCQDETSKAKRLMKELRLMEVAKAKANQFELMEQSDRIKAQLALEKAAEKKAQREAFIFMEKEKQERRRELKAAAKERKRLLIQQRAEEKAAKIAEAKMKKKQLKKKKEEEEMAVIKEDLRVALALAKGRKARMTKAARYDLTAYQKKQKKAQSASFLKNEKNRFSDFSVLEDLRDVYEEETTDLSRIKNDFVQGKRLLSDLEKEEHEEVEGMGTIEKLCSWTGSTCGLLPGCTNEKDSSIIAISEYEPRPRSGPPPNHSFARLRLNKPSHGRRSKSPNLRKPSGKNNTQPRCLRHKQHSSDKEKHILPSHQIHAKKHLSRSELEKFYAF
jgi:hypothetical protein